MSTYIFRLISHCGEEYEALVSLQKTYVKVILQRGSTAQLLATCLWGALKRMTVKGLRTNAVYAWDREQARVTAYLNGEPVGWANIRHPVYEGQIECLFWYVMNVDTPAWNEDYWRIQSDRLLEEPGYEFDAINALLETNACDGGAILPQFLVSAGMRVWEQMFKVHGIQSWLAKNGLGEILMENPYYRDIAYEYQLKNAQKAIDDDPDTPDWLRSASTDEELESAGAFDDLELEDIEF